MHIYDVKKYTDKRNISKILSHSLGGVQISLAHSITDQAVFSSRKLHILVRSHESQLTFLLNIKLWKVTEFVPVESNIAKSHVTVMKNNVTFAGNFLITLNKGHWLRKCLRKRYWPLFLGINVYPADWIEGVLVSSKLLTIFITIEAYKFG